MTNEAVLMIETELAIPMTVSNSTGIAKGAICKLSDPFTATLADGEADLVAGIAKNEKIASDGKTKLSIYRGGIWKGIASGSIGVGDPIAVDGDGETNYIFSIISSASLSGAKLLGTALEAVSDEETFLFELRPSNLYSAL